MGTDWDRAVGSAGSPPCSGTVSPAVGGRSAGMVLWGLFQSWERFSIDVHPAHVYSMSFSPSCHQLLPRLSSSLTQSLSFWSSYLKTRVLSGADWWVSIVWSITSLSYLSLPSADAFDGVGHRCRGQMKNGSPWLGS